MPVARSEPCAVDIGDSPIERWFGRVHCDIQRLSEFDRDLGLVEVVLHEGRLVRRGHLEPESWAAGHSRISGTIYGAEIKHEYWRSVSESIDSLLTDLAVFKRHGNPGELRMGVSGGFECNPNTEDQLVAPGDRVLGLIERVPFDQVLVGRAELWKLRRALVIGPEGYSVATIPDLAAMYKGLVDAAPGPFYPANMRELSEPLDASSVGTLVADSSPLCTERSPIL